MCVSVHHMHAWYRQRAEGGSRYPGTEVKDGCERPCGRQESRPDSLQEQRCSQELSIPPAPSSMFEARLWELCAPIQRASLGAVVLQGGARGCVLSAERPSLGQWLVHMLPSAWEAGV